LNNRKFDMAPGHVLGGGTSNRLYLPFEYFVGRRQVGPLLSRWTRGQTGFGEAWRSAVDHRDTHGLSGTAVLRTASTNSLAVKLIRIELEHQTDHAPGDLFRLLVVLIEGIANKAELALNTE
jgi:hypothetical protein